MNHNNVEIINKKSEIKSISDDFREFIALYGFRYKKRGMKV